MIKRVTKGSAKYKNLQLVTTEYKVVDTYPSPTTTHFIACISLSY